MAESLAANVVVAHFDDELWVEGFPLARPFGAPPAGAAGRTAGKARGLFKFFEFPSQAGFFSRFNPGSKTDMMQQMIIIVEAEKQRTDNAFTCGITEPADHAIGGAKQL